MEKYGNSASFIKLYDKLELRQKLEIVDPLHHFFPYIANLTGPVRPTFGDEKLVEKDLLMFGSQAKELVRGDCHW